MGRVSGGAWYQDVLRVAQVLGHGVTGPQLTVALLADRDTLSLAMARRLSSAYRYAASKAESDVFGSIAVCEQLQAIERLDPTAIADIIGPALAGRLPLSALQAVAASTRARLSANSGDGLTLVDLVNLCPEWEEQKLLARDIEYEQIRDSDRVVVDTALYKIDVVEQNRTTFLHHEGRWCMLVSPHVKCATIRSTSYDDFITRILLAPAFYARVSVICSSSYEREMVEKQVQRSRHKDCFTIHHLDDKLGRRE